MKTKKTGQDGFVLIFVIIFLALIATYMILLAGDANTFAFEVDRAYLKACNYNLLASGLAWTKQNVNVTQDTVSLDTAGMDIKDASLIVAMSESKKGKAQAEINTSCSRAGHKLTSSKQYTIETRP